MKFMKLGSQPDAFQAEGTCVRHVSSELATDIIVNVADVKFYLHKFPLLSKSNRMQKLVSKLDEDPADEIRLADFPGGPKAFEICAKFCYGITVTLNPYNVVAARCAAEYLEMTEDTDRGNLILKIEIFLNSSILRTWKDSIIALQTTKSLLPWSENLKIVDRCVDSIASKTSVDPLVVTWSYTYNRKLASADHGTRLPEKMESVPKDWWIEDVCELEIDLYKKVMTAIKSKGRTDGSVIAEALKTYATRWLPYSVTALVSEDCIFRNKQLLETIICLLPPDKVVCCSCSFLLKLLKVAILVGVNDSFRDDLIRSVSSKLNKASVSDLLIPSRPPQTTTYDIELVQHLVDQFVANEKIYKDGEIDSGCASLLKVGEIVDGFLGAIAHDPNLSVSSFIKLVQSIPDSARPVHDGLYAAIDAYLKEHWSLTKSERKSLCGLTDVKKLSSEVSMHAAQNERLPLRMVVQLLFFEQVRAAATGVHVPSNGSDATDPPGNTHEKWIKTSTENRKSLRKQMDDMKVKEEEFKQKGKLDKKVSSNASSGGQLPTRSRRIFDRLWIVGKGLENAENKSSETSASSQSPGCMLKSSGSSSRNRRHSIS